MITPGDLHMPNTRLHKLIKLMAETGERESRPQISRVWTENNKKGLDPQ
jgi:hypothetical protein